tara:strand:+ start:85 stop:534 length:450 start_codon:yes stop_codon:yes gene_type:complete
MQNISEIEELIRLISKLPVLGPKSAKRIVLKLINNREELTKPMAKALAEIYNGVSRCKNCGTLKSNSLGCNNCESSNNKFNKICIVENISDQWTIENSNIYQGYYHILGGTVSSSNNGSSKQDLLIDSLINRIKKEKIDEVILATSATI